MKIIFICGSLEPGRDGVGDYTRKLAAQIISGGHQAGAIALNDSYIKQNIEGLQEANGIKFPVIRLTSFLSRELRFKALNEWLNLHAPDWVSIQYVPYSFHKRGIPLYLGSFLSKLDTTVKWHLMIHEPFLAKQQSLKNKIIRLLQMFSLRLIIRNLKPAIFHTSIPQYQKLLREISISSQLLGLFGNIDIQQPQGHSREKGIPRKKKITGLYFGKAPGPRQHPVFAQKIKAFCENYQFPLQIIICGQSGKYGKQFATAIEAACKGLSCEITFLAELQPVALSNMFLEADFGIARIPPEFLGKSGSAISMLEHGLPLWVPLLSKDTIYENLDFRPDLCFQELATIIHSEERKECINRLPEIATKFLQGLNSYTA